MRGASWNNDNPDNFRCAYRNNNRPDNRNDNNGFRCASTLFAGVPAFTEGGSAQERVQAASRLRSRCRAAEYQKGARSLVAPANGFSLRHPDGRIEDGIMRRAGDLIDRICMFDNLLWAARRAAFGKWSRPDAARFRYDLEGNLLALRDALRSGAFEPGPHHVFSIRDPKPRTISAAPFCDRVAHHAICRHVAPVLERGLIPDCFANRIGLGTHAALDRCTQFARRYAFALKCDVSRYFPSIDSALLKEQLARAIKCGPTLDLLARIIDRAAETADAPAYFVGDDLFTPHSRARGIPIGNLTSQHFGNSYLGGFDHWVKQELRAPGYLRFVDDFVLFSDSRRWLAHTLPLLRERMSALRLELHPGKCRVVPTRCGVEFLGWRVFPDHRLLRRTTGVRFQRRLRALAAGCAAGEVTQEEVRASVLSWIGHLRHGDTFGLRRALLERSAFVWRAPCAEAPA